MVKHGVHRTLWNERVWRSVRPLRARGLAVLTYHRVGCQRPFSPGIPVDVFRKQIRWISRNCKVVSPEDVPTTCFADRVPRRPSVLVTFDDGYRDYYTTAYPILREFSVRAVNFLATRFLDGSSHFWWDRVDAAVALSRVRGVRLPWNGRHIPMAGDGAREVARLSKAELKRSAVPDRSPMLQELLSRLGFPDGPPIERQVMTWDEVRLTALQTTFGGHTHRHAFLPKLDGPMMAAEVRECRDLIASQLGVRPRLFAYPNGGWNESSGAVLIELGFEAAFTTQPAFNSLGVDPLLLGRFHAPMSAEKLAWMLSGWSKIL